ASRFGMHEPMVELLKPFGITPQVDRVVYRQQVLPDRRSRAIAQHRVDQWPTELGISKAIGGMPGVFIQPAPLLISSAEASVHPLAKITGEDLWASRDFMSQNPQPSPEENITEA